MITPSYLGSFGSCKYTIDCDNAKKLRDYLAKYDIQEGHGGILNLYHPAYKSDKINITDMKETSKTYSLTYISYGTKKEGFKINGAKKSIHHAPRIHFIDNKGQDVSIACNELCIKKNK